MIQVRLISEIEKRMPFATKSHLDSDLFDELGFDSIGLLDLICALEDEFGFQFSEEELSMDRCRTPRKLLTLIRAHQGQPRNS